MQPECVICSQRLKMQLLSDKLEPKVKYFYTKVVTAELFFPF